MSDRYYLLSFNFDKLCCHSFIRSDLKLNVSCDKAQKNGFSLPNYQLYTVPAHRSRTKLIKQRHWHYFNFLKQLSNCSNFSDTKLHTNTLDLENCYSSGDSEVISCKNLQLTRSPEDIQRVAFSFRLVDDDPLKLCSVLHAIEQAPNAVHGNLYSQPGKCVSLRIKQE